MAKLGKNLIDIVTFNLYDGPKNIFREYIQNCADAIDTAVNNKILESHTDGQISIILDRDERTIIIEDNGIGLNHADARRKLVDIADSDKDRDTDKGFYGIGRLTGLGFCDKVSFETSSYGEAVKTLVNLNALLARKIIDDKQDKSDAIQLIEAITTITSEPEETAKHYFKVTLHNVHDISDDELLNFDTVKNYLRMVAPIPFDRTFQYFYNQKIEPFMKGNGLKMDVYNIYLGSGNTSPEKLTKCYNTSIYDKTGKKLPDDEVKDLAFLEFKDNDGALLAWGWHSISNFTGVIPDCYQNRARGIRFRKHNIQIGDEETFVKNEFHKEPRGNKYFFGEIHVIHKDLVPNSQRNDFTQNETYQRFKKSLKSRFLDLFSYYQEASKIRSAFEAIKKVQTLEDLFETKKPLSSEDRDIQVAEIKKATIDAERKRKEIGRKEANLEDDIKSQIFKNISSLYNIDDGKKTVKKAKPLDIDVACKNKGFFFDDLSQLNKNERKLVAKVFKVIADNIPDKKMVESLAIKVKDAFK